MDETNATRLCKKCGVSKAADQFHKDKKSRDGLSYSCKDCAKARASAHYYANHEQEKARRREYHAANRDELTAKHREYWHRTKEYRRVAAAAYRAANKAIISERGRIYRHKNQETVAERRANWRKQNPDKVSILRRASKAMRRARQKAGGSYKAADILDLQRLQRGRCAACVRPLGRGYHVDHVQPLARGGRNDKKNLQLLCPSCNQTKSARDPLEFMQSLGKLL